ncbi:MAG: DoxX family protein [Thermoanaerobaculales bacterium]|nr:DoxX family protein [Thermoanaerobaculales bacterium]
MTRLGDYAEHAYAMLRIMAGFMFAMHGVQKVFGLLTERETEVFSQLWFGGIIELVCGILILIGFQTT